MVNLYRCYSGKMNTFLRRKGFNPIFKARDFNNDKTFWLYEVDEEFDFALDEWSKQKSFTNT